MFLSSYRWRVLVDGQPLYQNVRKLSGSQLVQARCDICSEDVNNLHYHVGKENPKHENNAQVVNHFVAHCDFKKISPVTCSTEEVLFYLKYIYPKTLMPIVERKMFKPPIFQVLGVLSKIHDPIDGQEVSGSSIGN